jgi:hypothetical protein
LSHHAGAWSSPSATPAKGQGDAAVNLPAEEVQTGRNRQSNALLDERRFHSVRFEEFLDIVPTSGTLGTVRERPRQFADQARRCLKGFPYSLSKHALLTPFLFNNIPRPCA